MYLKKNVLKAYISATNGKIDITDPCYDSGTCCRMTVDVKPTDYRCVYYVGSNFNDDEIKEYTDEYNSSDENSYIRKTYDTLQDYINSHILDIKHRCFEIEIQEKGRAFPRNSIKWKIIGRIGVDAGMAGFFTNKPDFNDDEWDEFCNFVSSQKGPAYFKDKIGFWSDSGYGDGGYDVEAIKENNKIIAIRIIF